MQERLTNLQSAVNRIWQTLNIDAKIAELDNLKRQTNAPELWKNPDRARELLEKTAHLENEINSWQILRAQTADLTELFQLADNDPGLLNELDGQLAALENDLKTKQLALRFTGPYDHHNAILRLTAGTGGTEAMDWAGILERMYLRFAKNHHFKISTLERTVGEEAGIKTAVYEFSGRDVYGLLKSEHGAHRLVRLSPFNADHLRQTSFALVEVLPIIQNPNAVKIADKDLRIDVYHSGGHGGQSVNTTNSAVRVTHLPTNTVVAIQNERSQLQNKEKALEILRGKLAQMQLEQHTKSIDQLRAGQSASWGQQIRNYILQPYRLVKDTRTKHETTNVDAVLDGNIEEFINAFLEQ